MFPSGFINRTLVDIVDTGSLCLFKKCVGKGNSGRKELIYFLPRIPHYTAVNVFTYLIPLKG